MSGRRRRSILVPMAKVVAGNWRVLRINEIDGVVGFFPGVDDVFSEIDMTDLLAFFQVCCRVVDDNVAGFGETDADGQVAVARGLPTFWAEQVPRG